MANRSHAWACCAAALTLAVPAAADAPCTRSILETFGANASGVRYGAAVFVDIGGFPRAKLVSDFVPGSWGSWVSPQIDEEVVEKSEECAYRPLLVLFGILDQVPADPEVLSYESPFGVGYLVAQFRFNLS